MNWPVKAIPTVVAVLIQTPSNYGHATQQFSRIGDSLWKDRGDAGWYAARILVAIPSIAKLVAT